MRWPFTCEIPAPRVGTSFTGSIDLPGSNRFTRGAAYISIPIGLILLIIGILASQKMLLGSLKNKEMAIGMYALGSAMVILALFYLGVRAKSAEYCIPKEHADLAKMAYVWRNKNGQVFMTSKKAPLGKRSEQHSLELHPKYFY